MRPIPSQTLEELSVLERDCATNADQEKGDRPKDTTVEAQHAESTSKSVGQKKKANSGSKTSPKQRKTSADPKTASSTGSLKKEEKEEEEHKQQEPCLKTPALEFDYDRSKLRDPRPTPGRKAHPRQDNLSARHEIKDWVSENFYIPKPPKPPGRLNNIQKNTIFRDECRLNPFEHFHHLYVCHDKGREGSPTYEVGGFELDWKKVV